MCSRDHNHSGNSEVRLLSQEKSTVSVSEFQDVQEKPKILRLNNISPDVSSELTDETINVRDEEKNHRLNSNQCEYNLKQNKDAQNDCLRAPKYGWSKCRKTRDTHICRKKLGLDIQNETLIKIDKQCSCCSNDDVFVCVTDTETSNVYNNQYQNIVNTLKNRLRKMFIQLKPLLIVLAVAISIGITILSLMMAFKLSEMSDRVSTTDDATPNKANETIIKVQVLLQLLEIESRSNDNCERGEEQELYPYIRRQMEILLNRQTNITDSGKGRNEEGYNNPPINDALVALINQLTSRRRSVIHLESKSQTRRTGNIKWSPTFAPQGDLTLSNDEGSIQVTNGGIYVIYSRVQFSRNANANDIRSLTLGFTLLRTNKDGVIIDKDDVQHPSTIHTVMLLEKEDKVSVSVPEYQQKFLSRDAGKHTFGMFEL